MAMRNHELVEITGVTSHKNIKKDIDIRPPELILAPKKKIFVVFVPSSSSRSLCGKLLSWTNRREGFDVMASVYQFRDTGFGDFKLPLLDTTHYPSWQRYILLFGRNTMSSLERTQCPRWKRHLDLFGNYTVSFFWFDQF